jgi:crotonobetainyl-CoA:carnitine CoA-transferase CaiB-like acyl-CoA transferase
VVVYTDKHWRAFTALVGCPDLIDTDARFASQQSRTLNAEAAGSFLAGYLSQRSNADWLEALRGIDIPACPVNGIEDLMADPHLCAVGLFEQIEHPTEGTLTTTRFPVRFSETPADTRRLAPNLGEHTEEVVGK